MDKIKIDIVYMRQDTRITQYLPYPQYLLMLDISGTAKVLYALLLNRATLSQRNAWMDDEGNVYIVYTIDAMVEEYTDFIFVNRFGEAQHQGTINKAIDRIIRDCNDAQFEKSEHPEVLLPHFSCHNLRHTFTTRMVEAGVNVKVIQDALGHKEIQTTLIIYADVTKELRMNEAPITALQNESEIVILQPGEIYMVRVENGDTVIYGENNRYRSRKRLYEIHEQLGTQFMQISKSTLVNLSCMDSIEAGFGGTLLLKLKNGCRDYVSRTYLPAFKKYLGL